MQDNITVENVTDVGLNYVGDFVKSEREEYTTSQGELKFKFKLTVSKEEGTRFILESLKDPLEVGIKTGSRYVFPIGFRSFTFNKDSKTNAGVTFYLRDNPILAQ